MKGIAMRRLATAWLALWCCGCAVGPDFVRPDPPEADRYGSEAIPAQIESASGDAVQRLELGHEIAAQWWTLYRAPELDHLLARAVAANPTLAAARATLAQAREAVVAAQGGLYPEVTATAGASRERSARTRVSRPSIGSATANLYSLGVGVSYALDVFGGVRRQIEQQEALADTQHYELAAAYLTLTGDAVTQAIAIASLSAQLAAGEQIVANDEENLALVQRKFDAGKAARSDVLTAQTQLASDQTLLPPLRQQLAAAHHALAVLAGELPAHYAPPDFELAEFAPQDEIPVTLPSEFVRQRPDILAAEARLHAASAAIGVATADLFPSLTLSGSLGTQALTTAALFSSPASAWVIAADAAAPIFRGGTLRAQRRASIAAYDASLATYQQTVHAGFQQVADLLSALAHDRESTDAQRALFDSAQEALRLQRIGYSAGKSDALRLVDAQRSFQQASLGVARARAQQLQDLALLLVALGGGWSDAAIAGDPGGSQS
jgi:NodT family efflux transporter outer membrane factor (OMF) lipoprotein